MNRYQSSFVIDDNLYIFVNMNHDIFIVSKHHNTRK